MKKLTKNFVVLASSFFLLTSSLFVSCANDVGDDDTPAQTVPSGDENKNQQPTNPGTNNPGTNEPGITDPDKDKDKDDSGEDNTKPVDENKPDPFPVDDSTDFEAPDLSAYYKKYFVTTDADAEKFGINAAEWGCGSTITPNQDGTLTLISAANMWGGSDNGSVAAFTGFADGLISKYKWIVFTLDLSDYNLEGSGVNVKVCHPSDTSIGQLSVKDNWVDNTDGTRTYYAPVDSETYANTKEVAHEIGLVIYGTGTTVVKELYVAAESDPANTPVTGITISPDSANILQSGKQQFTVKDSNLVTLTSGVIYSLSGDAAEGSSISEEGLLTVGTKAGDLTVTAKYTVDGKDFTATASLTVIGELVNLVSSVNLNRYADVSHDGENNVKQTGDIVTIADNTVTLNKPADTTWGEWSCQLFLDVKSSSGDIFEAGRTYFISVTVNSTATLNNCIFKDEAGGKELAKQFTYEAGVDKVLTAEITPTANQNAFNCVFSFPGDASTITISDFKISDITE